MKFKAFYNLRTYWDPIIRVDRTIARWLFERPPESARDGTNVVEITMRHTDVDEEFPKLLEWAWEHKCSPHYIQDPVVARMDHRFTLACPSRDIQMLAKLRWGGK